MRDAIATKRSRRLMLVAVGLLAAAAVLPLLVPPSAVAWELLPVEDRLALEATEIGSAKVCGASECREVSDPEAATALAVGPAPRGTDAPARGLPWYKSTLTIPAKERGEVRVSVADTGPGIAAEDQERIFEEFQQTEVGVQQREGTGLGLSQVYGFATQAGGRLDIASSPGVGTTVRIYLPASGR